VQSFHLDTTLQFEFEHIQFQDSRHDFSFLSPHLEGATFLGGAPLRGQSLLRLDFTSSGNFKEDIPLFLYIEFFAGGRVILSDRENRVIRATRKGGPHHRPGAHYWPGSADLAEFGQELPLSPSAFSDWPKSLLDRVRRGGDAPLEDAECRGVRGFSPLSVRYLVERSRPQLQHDPTEVLARRLGRWIRQVHQRRETIHVLSFRPDLQRPCQLLPFAIKGEFFQALQREAMSVSLFDDFVPALNFMGKSCLARQQMSELMTGVRRALDQRLTRNRRLARKLEADWERAASGGELRRMADTLSAYLHQAKRAWTSSSWRTCTAAGGGWPSPGSRPEPAGKPGPPLQAGGQRRAGTPDHRDAPGGGAQRHPGGRGDPLRAPARLGELPLPGAGRDFRASPGPPGAGQADLAAGRAAAVAAAPCGGADSLRRYELPGGWLVLVGRNNRENDLLTHREAAAEDIWLHAAGVSGSHVILRTGGTRARRRARSWRPRPPSPPSTARRARARRRP